MKTVNKFTALSVGIPLLVLTGNDSFAQGRMQVNFSDGKVPAAISRPSSILQPNFQMPQGARRRDRNGTEITDTNLSQRCRSDYVMRYCMLATRNLTLKGNASTESCDSSSAKWVSRSNRVAIGCYGTLDVSRGHIPVYQEPDGFKWSPGSIRFLGSAPFAPPHPALPLQAVLRPPVSKRLVANPEPPASFFDAIQPAANEIYDISLLVKKMKSDEPRLKLGGGDYICSGLVVGSLEVVPKQRVRLFLTDNANVDGYAFVSAVNAHVGAERFHKGTAADFQIWYNGQGIIKLDHNTRFCGIIYAPNASVEMGSNNCSFEGAIVARDISCGGNTNITYDENLARISLDR